MPINTKTIHFLSKKQRNKYKSLIRAFNELKNASDITTLASYVSLQSGENISENELKSLISEYNKDIEQA